MCVCKVSALKDIMGTCMQVTQPSFSFACVCRSQQKAAGRASSPMHQPATAADGPRASAPVPPITQCGLPEPAPNRPSAPDGLSLAEPNAEPPLNSIPADKAVPNMLQLQSNLMRPATPPSAQLQAAAADQADLQGSSSANHRLGHPPADLVCPQVLCFEILLFISSSFFHCS